MSRAPTDIGTTRMGPLARLPAFFALENKRAVVAGGTQAATWKAELLSAAGARVDVFAPAPGEDMLSLAAAPPRGAVMLHGRSWTDDDFAGAAIAVADAADDDEAQKFAAAARAAGVPVNVIDRPAFCDFSFGAIVNRSPLVIGISTDGASPVFGQAIRAKIEALIPKGFARWADAARAGARACRRSLCRSAAGAISGRNSPSARSPRRTRRRPMPISMRCSRRRPRRQIRARLFSSAPAPAIRSFDPARRARAAIGRRDPVRRSGVAGHPRFRAPRSKKNAGRQNRPRAVMQAGRHQRADDLARQSRPPRGAAQRRRPDDFWPRRRRNRGLPRGRHRGRSGARHHHGARRREQVAGVADAPRQSAPRAISSPAMAATANYPPTSTGQALPIRR